MENIGIFEVVKKIRRMNVEEVYNGYLFAGYYGGQEVILTDLDMKNTKLPAGYEYNEKNGVTNKHHTASGMYEAFPIYSLEELV